MNKNHKRCNRLGLWGAPIPHSMQKAICLGLWRLCISFLLPAAQNADTMAGPQAAILEHEMEAKY